MQAQTPQEKPEVFTVHYVLKNRIGELVDTSEGSEPLHFLYGSPEIIEGIQEAKAEPQASTVMSAHGTREHLPGRR